MREFSGNLASLYDMAEVLRDHAMGTDKDLFNNVRRALYDLRDAARYQADRWEATKGE